ncbi:MAG: sulfotransferase [Cyanobacteria bacterium J06632_3]
MLTRERRERLLKFTLNPSNLLRNISYRIPKNISKERHIFVVGAPRSGTTLIKQILAVHTNLSGPGYETGIFMFKDIFSFGFPGFDAEEISTLLEQSQDIVQFFDRFAAENLTKEGGQRFVEKTPPHVLRLRFLLKHFPNAQFINIVRDGRDCYCSAQHHPYILQARSVEAYARYWKRCIQSRLHEDTHPNIYDIKYEDLVRDPETHVRKLMDFLGEQYDPRQIDSAYYSQNRAIDTNKKYLNNLAKPISNKSEQRWMREMSSSDVAIFNSIAGEGLKQFGYVLS